MSLRLTDLRRDYQLIYKINPDLSARIAALIEFVKICQEFYRPEQKKGKKLRVLALCHGLEISERTLFRWRRAYILNGIVGLTRRKAPGKKAQPLTCGQECLIQKMRKEYRWGAEVMQAHLLRDHREELTKYRIERYLTHSGLRDKYPCTTRKRRQKSQKKHAKVVKIYHPGEHTQMDTKHQPHLLENKTKCYVFNFIDHASNWSYKRAYASLSPKSTIDFMKRLKEKCPFKIDRLQTDNGTEYTYRFYKRYADLEKPHPLEIYCENEDIKHRLIPPGEKELQGLVERSHRQDDQELFSRIKPLEIEEFNRSLEEYCEERNKGRRFKKLSWRTPNEWLWDYQVVSMAFMDFIRRGKRDEDLLPILKNDGVPKLRDQLTIVKSDLEINTCKDKIENVEKHNIKKAS
jgi:hypothetical protein